MFRKPKMARRTTGRLVTTGRTVPIRGAISKMVSSSCIARLLVMAAEDQQSPIIAYIDDSASGMASEALRIVSTIDGIRAAVATFSRGRASGAATLIAVHGLRGFRVASPTATFSFKFDSEARQHESVDSYLKLIVDMVAADSQQTVEKVRAWIKDGVEFTAEQAKANGLVDKIGGEPLLPAKQGPGPTPLV